jgi:thiamine-phosphate pyrophosphorylase
MPAKESNSDSSSPLSPLIILPRLYAVTDEAVLPNARLVSVIESVLDAGVRFLQLRFKQTPFQERLELGRNIRELCSRYGAFLVVNDSPELASEISADGVHLGVDDARVDEAKRILGHNAIIGVSAYGGKEETGRWNKKDVSYIGLLSPYPSTTKEKVSIELPRFKEVVRESRVPVYGIGGITPDRVEELMDAGCQGVAVISAIFGTPDPCKAAKEFLEALSKFD